MAILLVCNQFLTSSSIDIVTVKDCLEEVLFKMGFYYSQKSTIYNWVQLTVI